MPHSSRRPLVSHQTAEQVAAARAAEEARVQALRPPASRPLQLGPTNPHRGASRQPDGRQQDDDVNQADDEGPSTSAPRQRAQPHAPAATGERVRRFAAKWKQKRQQHIDHMRAFERRKAAHRAKYAASVQALLQERMACSLQQHGCCMHHKTVLEKVSFRTVTYHSLDVSVELEVRTMKCPHCAAVWEVSACEAGCFPSSPVTPALWFDAAVHNLYTYLAFTAGLSSTHFAAGLEYVRRLAGQQLLTSIPDTKFRRSWQEQRRAARSVEDPDSLGVDQLALLGAFRSCPACAPVQPDVSVPTAAAELPLASCATAQPEGTEPLVGTAGAPPAVSTPFQPAGVVRTAAAAAALLLAHRTGVLRTPLSGSAEAPRAAPHPCVPDYTLQPSGKVQLKSCMMDAVVKMNHYRSQGKAHDGIAPTFSTYLGAADKIVQHMVVSGTLPNMPDDHLDLECHPALNCARLTAKRGGLLDVFGIAGIFCCHGFPAEGCFINMPTHEQFAYYTVALNHVLLPERQVDDIYLDVGCQYGRTWAAVSPDDLKDPAPRFRVPWMHARSHGRTCFLLNSGLYSEGAGRRVGEQSEQAWATMKPYGRITRFMALCNRQDFVDDGLGFNSLMKARSFAALLAERYRFCQVKTRDLEQKCRNVEAYAVEADITVVQLHTAASLGPLPAADAQRDAKAKWQMQYVRLYLERRVLRELRTNGGAFAMALPGVAGRSLHAKGVDVKRREKVASLMGTLQGRLGLLGAWDPTCPDFQAAAAWVQEDEIERLHKLIEDEVAQLATGRRGRTREGAANQATKNMLLDADRRHKRVHEFVAMLQSWEDFDTSMGTSAAGTVPAPPRWTEEAVSKLFASIFPWRDAFGSTAVLQRLAAQYKEFAAELERTREELHLLAFEARQALLFYAYKRRAFAETMRGLEAVIADLEVQVAGTAHLQAAEHSATLLAQASCRDCMQRLGVAQAKVFVLRQLDEREEQLQALAKDRFVGMV